MKRTFPNTWGSDTAMAAVLLCCIGTPGLRAQPANHADVPPGTSDPVAILSDVSGNASQPQRDEAARRVLARYTDGARKILRDALISPDAGGEQAVARALAQDPDPDSSFIDPLFPLLQNRDLAADAARALCGYQSNPTVLTRLIDLAAARRTMPDFTRLAAIRAIGSMPERRAAALLVDLLTSADESNDIHRGAGDALIEMTGLDQNGRDPLRWSAWWSARKNASDDEFRKEISAHQNARLDRLGARYNSLSRTLRDLLRAQYHSTKAEQVPALALSLLRSSEPEIRSIGTELIDNDVTDGKRYPSAAELVQLRDMVADYSPAVRAAVANMISKLNDSASLDALLAQLKTEPDPTVRAAIATALGQLHDVRAAQAMPTLMQLLGDESLPTAEAAAKALGDLASGPLANDATQRRNTAEVLRQTALQRIATPGAEDLIAGCIASLAPLRDFAAVQSLLDAKFMSGRQQPGIRKAMVLAVGELRDEHRIDAIGAMLNDPDDEVQRQAIHALAINPNAAQYAQAVGDLVLDASRKQSVRDDAWRFMKEIFPRLNERDLEGWSTRFPEDPQKSLVARQALAAKQKAAGEMDKLAITQAQIGGDYDKLKQYDFASESYKTALDIYGTKIPEGRETTFSTDEELYIEALLNAGHFEQSITFASTRIKADPSEQGTMGRAIAKKVDELKDDPRSAKDLIDRALKMNPPLDERYRNRLIEVAERFPKKTSSSDIGIDSRTAWAGKK